MEFVLYVKNLMGVSSDDPVVLYAICVLILSVIALSCFVNILGYVIVNYYLLMNNTILEKLNRFMFVNRVVNILRKTSTTFIMLEFISLVVSMSIIIQTSFKIVYNLM